MGVQWFPGHMTRARRELAEVMPNQDVVLEVRDARLPEASRNPLVAELRGTRPMVLALTRRDLADEEATRAWAAWLPRAGGGVHAVVATDAGRADETRKAIVRACVAAGAAKPGTALRVLVCGVPNVGKSTLINTLAGRAVAQAGDKPAVTKRQQQVVLPSGIVITDSPGLMWPKIEDPAAALRLALAGSIPDTAIDYQEVGVFAAGLLLARYPQLLVQRYKLRAIPATPIALLEEIGRRRGGLRPGGVIDLHKACEVLVHEFRQGAIGRMTLESAPAATPTPVA